MRLEVTPRLIRDDGENKIQMKVVFNNDAPDFTLTVQGNPSIFKRHQTTEVVVREGQRLVIGGVTNDQAANQVRQVPVLEPYSRPGLALQEPRDLLPTAKS